MKKKLIISILLIIPFFSISQDISYGCSAGLNMAKWTGDANKFANDLSNEINLYDEFSEFSFSNKSRIGFVFGFFIDFKIKESFSIQPEIQYVQKGTKFSGNGSITMSNSTFRVKEVLVMQTDYIDLLVLAKFDLAKNNIKPYFIAGPGVSYLVSSKMKVKVTIENESDSDHEDYEGFKKVDANFNFGIGFDFAKTIRSDIRYQLGLSSIFKDEYSDGYEMKNRGLTFNLAVVF